MKNDLKLKLKHIIDKYEKYQNLESSLPSKHSNAYAPAYGYLRLAENFTCYEGYDSIFARNILVGVKIGSKFANYDEVINEKLRTEIVTCMKEFISVNHEYYLINQYGTAYSVIGIFKL